MSKRNKRLEDFESRMSVPVETETRYKRLWFGPKARVMIGTGFLHKSGFGALMIPHPPIANWLLRWGLPNHLRCDLSFDHEFAHFQTAPMIIFYMLVLLIFASVRGRTSIGAVLFVLASVQAAWELMSEGLVMLMDPASYRMSYNALIRLPRVLFWAIGGMLTVAGWVVVLHR